jgi:glucose/arabinose dehydrogenase
VTLGERQKGSPAQDLATTLGKVIRIRRDGTIPSDNPSITGARPEIFSYGHRNPQGAAIRPGTDELRVTEHGPQGGDELNRIVPGGNFGWPLVSYGCNYGDPVGDAFLGALAGKALWRIELRGNAEVARELLLGDLGERIRDVVQGPDGFLYVLTDGGKLIQLRD